MVLCVLCCAIGLMGCFGDVDEGLLEELQLMGLISAHFGRSMEAW